MLKGIGSIIVPVVRANRNINLTIVIIEHTIKIITVSHIFKRAIYKVNSKGPSEESCGKPYSRHLDENVLSPKFTLGEKPDKYDENHYRVVLEKLKCNVSLNKRVWSRVLNAADKYYYVGLQMWLFINLNIFNQLVNHANTSKL